jgi:anthranilate phosphoribosyltransferase
VEPAPLRALSGGGPEENAAWLSTILEGKGSAAHADAIALNAGTLAWVVGMAPTFPAGVKLARQALHGGGGARRLIRMAELSHGA